MYQKIVPVQVEKRSPDTLKGFNIINIVIESNPCTLSFFIEGKFIIKYLYIM